MVLVELLWRKRKTGGHQRGRVEKAADEATACLEYHALSAKEYLRCWVKFKAFRCAKEHQYLLGFGFWKLTAHGELLPSSEVVPPLIKSLKHHSTHVEIESCDAGHRLQASVDLVKPREHLSLYKKWKADQYAVASAEKKDTHCNLRLTSLQVPLLGSIGSRACARPPTAHPS